MNVEGDNDPAQPLDDIYLPPLEPDLPDSIPVSLSGTPDSERLATHSQTEPYLENEPTLQVSSQNIQAFLGYIFPRGARGNRAGLAKLNLSGIRHDQREPRGAEKELTVMLNECIKDNSPSTFYHWPEHWAPTGFRRDRRMDIAVIPRNISPQNPPISSPVASTSTSSIPLNTTPDVDHILACVEHTVISGSRGRHHNKKHAYAKLNELLKCPLIQHAIVFGIHHVKMTLWYGDRSGVLEVDLGDDFGPQAIVGLANLSFPRDPFIDRIPCQQRRVYKFNFAAGVYYGIYGDQDRVLYVGDGISGRGTLVIAGIRHSALNLADSTVGFNSAAEGDRVAIKISHPSLPWDYPNPANLDDRRLEHQVVEALRAANVRNIPHIVDHFEYPATTKNVRDAVGFTEETHRIRTLLVTQPLVSRTLRTVARCGIRVELTELVQVLKDVTDAHQDAWTNAGFAHCDISPGNIQIFRGRGILGDWEYATAVNQLSTPRAINSGTLITMPPRLAFEKYSVRHSSGPLSRTLWDEICSIFLCFLYVLGDDKIAPDKGPGDYVNLRMLSLLNRTTTFCEEVVRPQFQSDHPMIVPRLAAALQQLFPGRMWLDAPDDASSLEWWERMRNILDSFVL